MNQTNCEETVGLIEKKKSDTDTAAPQRHPRIITHESAEGVLSSLRLSRWYLAHCVLMTLLSLTLVILLLLRHDPKHPPDVWIVVLDGVVVLSIFVEVSMYWRSKWRILDMLILTLSMAGFIILVLEANQIIHRLNASLAIFAAAFRYFIQIIRIARFLAATNAALRSQAALASTGGVTFPPPPSDLEQQQSP